MGEERGMEAGVFEGCGKCEGGMDPQQTLRACLRLAYC